MVQFKSKIFLTVLFTVTTAFFLNSFAYNNSLNLDVDEVAPQLQLLKTKNKMKGKSKILSPEVDSDDFPHFFYDLHHFYALMFIRALQDEKNIKQRNQLPSPTLISKFIYFYLSDTSPPFYS